MNSILPPNATPLMRALEQVAARAFDIDHGIDKIANPDTCPARFLPFLAVRFVDVIRRPPFPACAGAASGIARGCIASRHAAAVREVVAASGAR